jgi:tripartite-type tricarboxylate transporter receptor subunit TctC
MALAQPAGRNGGAGFSLRVGAAPAALAVAYDAPQHQTRRPPMRAATTRIRSSRRGGLAAACAALLLGLGAPLALAQAWPSKPIRIVVNFPPGGAADVIARAVAAPLSESLGQPVVVENRAGSGGNLGGDAVAKSAPDGQTLLMSSGGMVSVNPHIYARMPFDPIKDLTPVAAAARVLVFLVVKPEYPANNARAFLDDLKKNPGKRSFGSPGNGSSPHLAGEMMKSQAGVFAVHVPYRGAAPALTDLLAGQLDFLFDPGIAISHVKAGRLKMLAVGSPQRSPLFPDVPTLDEVGLKGFDADTVFGFYAPAGTPGDVIARLNGEINRILGTPALRDRIGALGGEPAPMSPTQFATKAAQDSQRFGAIIRERKIRGD